MAAKYEGHITIVMTTYAPVPQRAAYAIRTMHGLVENIVTDASVRLHIADDGSTVQLDFMNELCYLSREAWGTDCTITNAMRGGIGKSLNLAMQNVGDMWMYITDDWLLTDKLDLIKPRRLIAEAGYDYVRLGPVHPDLRCITRFNQDLGWWLEIHPEFGGFGFATRPFLAARRLYESIGPFNEGVNSYEVERMYAERCSSHRVRMAATELTGPWEHIGEYEVGYVDPNNLDERGRVAAIW